MSRTTTGSSVFLPYHLVRIPVTELVSESVPPDSTNTLSPQIEFAVDDLPWPVTPIMQATLNFLDNSCLPALAAMSKTVPKSLFGTCIKLLICCRVKEVSASAALWAED